MKADLYCVLGLLAPLFLITYSSLANAAYVDHMNRDELELLFQRSDFMTSGDYMLQSTESACDIDN